MSSRLIPAKTGAMICTVRTISSTSWVSRHSGQASMPREPLEQRGLALHHRKGGLGADVAESEHGRPVGDHGDGVALDGESTRVVLVGRDRQRDSRNARGVDHRQIVAVADRMLGRHLDRPAEVHEECPVGDLADVDARRSCGVASTMSSACCVSRAAQVTSMRSWSTPDAVTSSAVTTPPAPSTAVVSWLTAEPRAGTTSRTVIE